MSQASGITPRPGGKMRILPARTQSQVTLPPPRTKPPGSPRRKLPLNPGLAEPQPQQHGNLPNPSSDTPIEWDRPLGVEDPPKLTTTLARGTPLSPRTPRAVSPRMTQIPAPLSKLTSPQLHSICLEVVSSPGRDGGVLSSPEEGKLDVGSPRSDHESEAPFSRRKGSIRILRETDPHYKVKINPEPFPTQDRVMSEEESPEGEHLSRALMMKSSEEISERLGHNDPDKNLMAGLSPRNPTKLTSGQKTSKRRMHQDHETQSHFGEEHSNHHSPGTVPKGISPGSLSPHQVPKKEHVGAVSPIPKRDPPGLISPLSIPTRIASPSLPKGDPSSLISPRGVVSPVPKGDPLTLISPLPLPSGLISPRISRREPTGVVSPPLPKGDPSSLISPRGVISPIPKSDSIGREPSDSIPTGVSSPITKGDPVEGEPSDSIPTGLVSPRSVPRRDPTGVVSPPVGLSSDPQNSLPKGLPPSKRRATRCGSTVTARMALKSPPRSPKEAALLVLGDSPDDQFQHIDLGAAAVPSASPPSKNMSPTLSMHEFESKKNGDHISPETGPMIRVSQLAKDGLVSHETSTRVLEGWTSPVPYRGREGEMGENEQTAKEEQELSWNEVKEMISQLIQESPDEGTLFRENGPLMKAITSYFRKIGSEYLLLTLQEDIRLIVVQEKKTEVDPRRMGSDDCHETNLRSLKEDCSLILSAILHSTGKAPLEVKEFCSHVFSEVKTHFFNSRFSAVGVFLFHRFFCPALISPQQCHLIDIKPSPQSQRGLMLVAKVLTNLSNGLSFGKKERYLMDMNEFIVKNQIELLSYLGAMGGVRERVDPLLKSLHLSEISVVCEVGEEEAHGEEEGEEQISGEIGDQPIEQYVTRLNHSQDRSGLKTSKDSAKRTVGGTGAPSSTSTAVPPKKVPLPKTAVKPNFDGGVLVGGGKALPQGTNAIDAIEDAIQSWSGASSKEILSPPNRVLSPPKSRRKVAGVMSPKRREEKGKKKREEKEKVEDAKDKKGAEEKHEPTFEEIKVTIKEEIAGAYDQGTLFRENSPAAKKIASFLRTIGKDYLITTLRPPLSQIVEKGEEMEVDPRKLEEEEKKREENLANLEKNCGDVLDVIVESVDKAPPEVKEFCGFIFREVGNRFLESRHSAVGGFLFLRFFCPALLTPKPSKILDENPPPLSRRGLILIAKILQNVSNGLKFGQKEQFMMDLNPFIEENEKRVKLYFEKMSEVEASDSSSSAEPKEIPNKRIALLLSHGALDDFFLRKEGDEEKGDEEKGEEEKGEEEEKEEEESSDDEYDEDEDDEEEEEKEKEKEEDSSDDEYDEDEDGDEEEDFY